MNMIMSKFHRYAKIRKLHTIISRETIKPSSPTPSHLKTHNLSLIDHIAPNFLMPCIFFYKNHNISDVNILKKSLSLTLTQYYPLAGKFPDPSASHIECNDEGVEFLEASNDSRINDFILKKQQDETLDQLFSKGLDSDMVRVQLTHFACGGAVVAVSISHKVCDAFTAGSFVNHWASLTCGGSPINPTFVSSSTSNIKMQESNLSDEDNVDYVSKRFIFPNSKLYELKKKVISELGSNHLNPTRVELLTSLLFKCLVGAATTISGCLHPSNLYQVMNMRNKIINCPEIAAGNICTILISKMGNFGEIKLTEVIAKMRKERMEVEEVRSVEEVGKMLLNTFSTKLGDSNDQTQTYIFSSACRFPYYNVDFGWGKPIRVVLRPPNMTQNSTILMDTPYGDGIEALVQLKKEQMTIFEKDKELLAYVEDNLTSVFTSHYVI